MTTLRRNPRRRGVTDKIDSLPLPEEIVFDILSRLPINSLFQCRCVCKSWRSLLPLKKKKKKKKKRRRNQAKGLIESNKEKKNNTIDDSRLAKMHYHFHSSSRHPNVTSLIIPSLGANSEFHAIPDIDSCKKPIKLNVPFKPSRHGLLTVMGSCNGFICLGDIGPDYCDFFVFNPVTGDCFNLPDDIPNEVGIRLGMFFGFGYSPKSKEYKVISGIHDRTRNTLKVAILTLGRNSWRSAGNISCDIIGRHKSLSGVFVNGFSHWLMVDSNHKLVGIRSFDVEVEKFGMVPLHDSMRVGLTDVVLREFAGCLMLVDHSGKDAQVWIMKDYSVKESWVLEFTIPSPLVSKDKMVVHPIPLAVQQNGNVLLECNCEELFSYDLKNGAYEKLRLTGLPRDFGVVPHVGTLVKLSDVIAVEGL